jgi:hypothetical protein
LHYKKSVNIHEAATRNAGSDEEPEEAMGCAGTKPDEDCCFFGHRTTTTRVRGKCVWNRNPACSWWPGRVPGLVTLCNKCFQMGRRHFLKGNKAPLPNSSIDACTEDTLPQTSPEAKRPRTNYSYGMATASSEERTPSSTPRSVFNIRLCITVEVDMADDEESAYAWAIEASLEDARQRAVKNETRVKVPSASVDIRRIPGVADVPTGTTRGPSLLGATPGVCGSPAKAEGSTEDSKSTAQSCQNASSGSPAECNGQMRSKRRRTINFDDVALDRHRIRKRTVPTGPYDDLTADHIRCAKRRRQAADTVRHEIAYCTNLSVQINDVLSNAAIVPKAQDAPT